MRKLIAIVMLAALPALAQTTKKSFKPEPAPKRITIDDPDEVYGANPSGQGDVISSIVKKPPPGMIKIRQNFYPEMYKLASDL
jgi:hypothetical protein